MKHLLVLLICFGLSQTAFAQMTATAPTAAGSFITGSPTAVSQTSTFIYTNSSASSKTFGFTGTFDTNQNGVGNKNTGSVTVTSATANGSGGVSISPSKTTVTVEPGTSATIKVTSNGSSTPSSDGAVSVVGTVTAGNEQEPTLGSASGTLFGNSTSPNHAPGWQNQN